MTPRSDVYALKSEDVRLFYIPNLSNTTRCRVKIVLIKLPRKEIISLTYTEEYGESIPNSLKTKRSAADEVRTQASYDHESAKITFWIPNVKKNYSGLYEVRLYVSDQQIGRHKLNITILSGI